MALLDDLDEIPMSKPARKCSVAHVLDQLEGAEHEKVTELFNDVNVPAAKLARVLVKNRHQIKVEAITRHRRKECACDA